MRRPARKDTSRTLIVRPNYLAFVFFLVGLSFVNSCLVFLVQDPEGRQVVIIVQACVSLFLLVDATFRLVHAWDRRRFLFRDYGWLYFLSSLPLPFICLARLVPMVVMVRRLRAGDYQALGNVIVEERAQNTLLTVVMAAVLVVEFASVAILGAEAHSTNANIKTGSDALWWAIVTIATVGYGDRYPVTNEGRVIGVCVIVVGVALFTTLSSFLAQWFLRRRSKRESAVPAAPDVSDAGAAGPPDAAVIWEQIRALLEAREAAHQREIENLSAQIAALQTTEPTPPRT
jgi:hypothetical protein